MIVIEPYNPQWPEEFNVIQAALQQALGDLAVQIDHIGSTSVPGLGAKDVIDIQVTVKELGTEIIQRLTGAGFQHWGQIAHDHVPLGEDADSRLWEKYFFNQPEGQRRANIHVRVKGNPNQVYPLLFRDYLRAHPHSARSIELIKREIAKRHGDDVETYYDIKDPVYDLIWDAAQDWARVTSWSPETGAAARAEDQVYVGSIVIRCYEFERMLRFWQAALRYVPRYTDEGWAILKDPRGKGPNVSLDKSLVKRTGKRSWLHLDLYTNDQAGEVERLVGLGAARYDWRYPPDADYIVLEDPDGNLFCVIQIPAEG